jgi:multidrug efflux pump
MWLSDISIRRPVLATVMSLLLIAFGILSFQRLPLRELPDIDPPIVSVSTNNPGATAQVIDTLITQPIEDQLSGLEGVKTITSSNRPGTSNISIEFNLGRDIEAATNDVRNAVSRVIRDLPPEIDPPQISKVDADASPILFFHLASDRLDRFELTEFAERAIVDRLSAIDGVAVVRIFGSQRYSMRVWLDRVAMAARGIAVSDVETALRRENVEFPAGALESHDRLIAMRLNRAYETPQDFARLVIRSAPNLNLVRLGDVAKVELGAADQRNEYRGNAIPQVGIGIVKQSRANSLAVAKGVRAEVARLEDSLPEGTHIVLAVDTSQFIARALDEVFLTLAIAMALVIAVIFLFLGSARAALIPAVTVPISITAAFMFLAAFGLSINLLTLLALVLAIGLVVDDAIVVLENVQRWLDEGYPPLIAAQNGTRQVGFAVLATTIVLISVFTPLAFLQDTVGRLFAELAITLAAAVGFSGFVALSLSPMMCSKLLRPRASETAFARALATTLDRATNTYVRIVQSALDRRGLILAGFVVVLAGAIIFFMILPRALVPPEDRGFFQVSLETPQGASYAYTREQMLKAETELMKYVKPGEIRRLIARVPAGGGGGTSTLFNTASVFVVLQDWSERSESADAMADRVRKALYPIPGVRAAVFTQQGLSSGGGGRGRPIDFVIQGPTYEELIAWRDIVMRKAEESGLMLSVTSDYTPNRPELLLTLDRERAAALGVSAADVGSTVQTLFGSKRVTRFLFRGEEREVFLEAGDAEREDLTDLSNVYVRSSTTQALIPLSNLISWQSSADADQTARFNRLRAITISADLAKGVPLGTALDFLAQTVKRDLPPGAQYDFKGQSAQFKEAQSSFLGTFGLALLVVFLVLAAQFESFRHPFIVMLCVPLAIAGALFGIMMTGGTLNIYSQVGIIILVGIAAKNGILLVEFANQLRDQGYELRAAIVGAARTRFRPIMMTGVATAVGAIPLIIATGPGAGARGAIGIVIFSGVLFATALTLVLVPVVYEILARGTGSPKRIARELDALEQGDTAKK